MNIGVFTIMLHSGGTERVIAKLSLLWSSLGHRVHFFTIRQPHDAEFTHKCVLRECAPEGRWTVADADRLHEECRLDLVVFNGGWNNAWVETLVCRFKQMNVHTIAILHHSFNNWAFAGCNEGDFDKERLLSHLDCLVCVDRMQALWWSRRHRKVVYMPNPCALEMQPELPAIQCGERGHKIVWIGRADDNGKRVNLAIEVLHEVRKRIVDVELTIVGALPKDWKCKEPGIKCVGYVADTTEFLKTAAVHLVTTLWEVTVPQVVLEAMAYGVPTVAFDLPVFRDADGIWPGKDVDSVASLTVDAMSFPDKYKILNGSCKISGRNMEIKARWGGLFKAFESGDVAAFIEMGKSEYDNLDVCGQLLDEIQRSEAFAVATQLPLINKIRRWKARWKRVKSLGFSR